MWPFRRRSEAPSPPAEGRSTLISPDYRALWYNLGPAEEEWSGEPVPPDRLVDEALRCYEVVRSRRMALAAIDEAERTRERELERKRDLAKFHQMLEDVGVDYSPAENPARIAAGLWFERDDSDFLSALICGTQLCDECKHVVGAEVFALSDVGAVLAGDLLPIPHNHPESLPHGENRVFTTKEQIDASETL